MTRELWTKWTITGLSLVCLIGIGIVLSQLLWLAVYGVTKPKIEFNSPRLALNAQDKAVNISEIQNWHLFGQLSEIRPAVKARPIEAPKTTLKLELLGVFLGANGAKSTAIIGEIGQDPDYFREGDTIAKGVILKEVHNDKVILDRNGAYETLTYAETAGSGAGGSVANASAQSSSSSSFSQARRNFLKRSTQAPLSENSEPAKSQLGQMVRSGKAYTPNTIVNALKQDLTDNPTAAIQELGLESGGDSGGYVISSNAPQDLLRTMGLRVGDRVLSVDGQSISGSASDSAIIQSAMQKSNVKVQVQRGTRTFTANVAVPR